MAQKMSQWNQCTFQEQYVHPELMRVKQDVDNFHVYHEISDYSTEVRSQVVFSRVLQHPVLDRLSLEPDTSVSTEFVHISSAKT